MKKTIRLITVTCIICLLASILALPASASHITIPRIVRIRNMWNSSYAVNDNGTAKYSSDKTSSSGVWRIEMCAIDRFAIMNWDGTYLRANSDGSVTSESCSEPSVDTTFQWYLNLSSDDGYTRITSYAYQGKAINIEHLTGALELTDYYDTWESAKWSLNDVSEPALNNPFDHHFVLQAADQDRFMYSGVLIGPESTMQAFINGNMFYEIVNNGDNCYIKYSPANGDSAVYLKATSESTYSTAAALDSTNDEYRWNIVKNSDGTSTIKSVAYPDKCIVNTQSCTLAAADNTNAVKWNIKPANSYTVKIQNSVKSHTLVANDSTASFKLGDGTAYGDEAEWQVVFNGSRMYLRNIASGKYLRSGDASTDTQAYVGDYDYDSDRLFIWNAVNLRYSLGLTNNNSYLTTSELSSNSDMNALIGAPNLYGCNNLAFSFVGFAD